MKIQNLEIEQGTRIWHSRNYLVFMFHTHGMNFSDLANLKVDNLHNNRVIYNRMKTKKLYNIKLTEKAKQIVELYTSYNSVKTDYLFPIFPRGIWGDTQSEHRYTKTVLKFTNDDAKTIALMCGIKETLTTYVIRHSWATIAKQLGVPTSVIQEGLGHTDSKTTETYLANFQDGVVDNANELIVGV